MLYDTVAAGEEDIYLLVVIGGRGKREEDSILTLTWEGTRHHCHHPLTLTLILLNVHHPLPPKEEALEMSSLVWAGLGIAVAPLVGLALALLWPQSASL